MKTKTPKRKKEKASITIRDFFKQFPTDHACLEHIFTIRFGQGHACPKCERKANWYKIQAERAYSCQWCGHHLHPTVGTPFEDSRTPLQLWFYAIYLFTTSRHGVPAKELERQLGVTYKCAWRMGHEIRKHIAQVDGEFPLFGQVEIDETYVGGHKRNAGRGRGASGKAIVFGMLQRGGQVMTKIVPNCTKESLIPIIEENVAKGSTVHTDEFTTYKLLPRKGYKHQKVSHGTGEYVNGLSHTNGLESFWARLKNSVKGTHVHVSKKHLDKYAKEFEYRYNSKAKPISMFPSLVSTFVQPST
jgi:transposase-like protein